jgi:putative phage-type endonuclease
MEQRSNAWFEARLGLATASSFDKVMAAQKTESYQGYKTDLVLERLYGMDAPHLQNRYTNQDMEWGVVNEPLARLAYMFKTGNKVSETGFHKHKALEAGASPDGIVSPKKGIEIKCPKTSTHIYTLKSGKLPARYVAQVQGQMFICGFNSVDFVSFDPRLPTNAQLIIIPVRRDNAYIEILEEKLKSFLAEVEDDLKFINNYGNEIQSRRS